MESDHADHDDRRLQDTSGPIAKGGTLVLPFEDGRSVTAVPIPCNEGLRATGGSDDRHNKRGLSPSIRYAANGRRVGLGVSAKRTEEASGSASTEYA
jgi:hypothetical protein